MLDKGGGGSSADYEALVRSTISRWRVGLMDVAAADRLLNLRPAGTGSIEVVRPAADDILSRLGTGGTFAFRSLAQWAAEPPPAPYLLDTKKEPDDLEAVLQALVRRSAQESLERGWPVLYLAFGSLTWADRDRSRHTSPLLLVPVRLVAAEARQPPMLEPTDDDPVINPALSLELSRDQITLPGVDGLAKAGLSGLLEEVRAAVAAKDGWLISESVVLSCFPPMNDAMYRDLLDHEELIAAHRGVRALAAGGPGASAGFAGASRHAAGVPQVPPVILDADSSQRACIMAALAGHSFTIDGPPGTGKSQTIANMVGALLHAGRTVLVVSSKAAALDVVADRLTSAGLAGYLLELHSHKATRRQVAASLAAALDTGPAAPAAAPSPDDRVAAWQPDQLRDYAHAVHRVRDPLGYSLHDVLAMIASMQAVPAAPATGRAPAHLTSEALDDICRTAEAVAAAWRPAAQGRSYPWRGVLERGPLDGRLYETASALESLARVVRGNQILADATGLTRPSDAHALARLLDHLLTWPETLPDEWLTVDNLDVVDAAAAQLTGALTAIAARETQASQEAGIPWPQIPQRKALPATGDEALAELEPACADVSGLGAKQITGLARDFSTAADLLEKWLGTLSGLAAALGLQPPVTFSNANDLLSLARLAGEHDRPERAWLSVPGYRAAGNAAQVLYDAHRALADAEAAARGYFTPDALREDVSGLARRFADAHHGLGRLSGSYRTDRRTVEAFTRQGVSEETALQNLGLAAAWRHAAEALAAAEARNAALLGPYYNGRATDFTRLERVLTHASNAIQCARGQDLSRAAGYLSRDAAPNGAMAGAVAKARQDLSAWEAGLAPAPAIAPRPELMDGKITDAVGWLRAHLGPLHAASEFTRAVGEVVGRPLTFGQARHLVALREAADAAHAQLSARDTIFRDLCAPLYVGVATDIRTLRETLEWARSLRAMITGGSGPLTAEHLSAAESAVPTDRLAKAADAWQEAAAALVRAFSRDHRPDLAAELDDYTDGYHLLEAMFNDPKGRDEWHAYLAASTSLAAHGMGAALDFCTAEGVEPAQIPQVIKRALLQEWSDHQMRTDPALAPLRAVGHDALAGRYKELDRALATAAAAEVIRACNARRPRGDTGESAIIRLEAAKKNGHLPVQELLSQAWQVTQAVKPCVLTSPLAASQYLPAGMNFDVVIVDEASRVSSAAAVNCIYRAGSVILAGDQRQLPPASFSSALDGGQSEPAEFGEAGNPESVLDVAKRSGAFGSLTLRWHYRSRHEALIAFSNAAFYEGRLLPLPDGGPEAGMELFYGEGVYRSRTARDNPTEAARVAQRVVHHYQARPALSLGVVAFSEAQAGAIETALGEARKRHPDLDRFFGTDRLHGFFVKDAEAAQGDERDVVILSVGYGPDEEGQITTDFGPLGRPGGWRTLNVAATRARHRVEIVSSIHASDIPESATGDGVRYLRGYLGYAAKARPPRGAAGRERP